MNTINDQLERRVSYLAPSGKVVHRQACDFETAFYQHLFSNRPGATRAYWDMLKQLANKAAEKKTKAKKR